MSERAFGSQVFVAKTAKIRNVSKFTDTVVNEDGTFGAKDSFFVKLDNGVNILTRLGVLSKAVGRNLTENDLILLNKADIEYSESERKVGLPFKWNFEDADASAMIATADGVVQGIDSIEPIDSRFEYLMRLPIYSTRRTAMATASNEHDNEPEDEQPEPEEEKPEGAVIDSVVTLKPNTKKADAKVTTE